jgi:hypothetical protein
MNFEIKPHLQILPGSAPGRIRVVGDKDAAEVWIPRIRADRQKIKTLVKQADELVELILLAANYYECPPEEISCMLNLAARDPENALLSYHATVEKLGLKL